MVFALTTCVDNTYERHYKANKRSDCYTRSIPPHKAIGVDIEPVQLALISHNRLLLRVASGLTSVTIDEAQTNLWSDYITLKAYEGNVFSKFGSYMRSLRPFILWDRDDAKPTYFVAGLESNTTTGVLREHLMRLNCTVSCEEIDRKLFPLICPGDQPFTAYFQRGSNDTDIRLCVPGSYENFPWSLSRTRQDHMEEIFLDLWDGYTGSGYNPQYKSISSTIHCTAKTTRGNFELGNIRNNNTYSPLLVKWPDKETMKDSFNDWADDGEKGYVPSEMYVLKQYQSNN